MHNQVYKKNDSIKQRLKADSSPVVSLEKGEKRGDESGLKVLFSVRTYRELQVYFQLTSLVLSIVKSGLPSPSLVQFSLV